LTNIRRELVKELLDKYHPKSVAELKARLLQDGIRSDDNELFEVLSELQREGRISLVDSGAPNSFPRFIADLDASWWILVSVAVAIVEILLVVGAGSNEVLGILRLLLGLGLLGFLPGYATTKIVFPRGLATLELILLSIFLSVVISIALGLVLGAGYFFTPLSAVALSSGYTIFSSLLAGFRQYSQWPRSKQTGLLS
jgi:hypothetical protein